ncbi:MAG: DUF2059 domain-containing protein [Caulobacter sp.]|nr:DUF2059 domain-containing protein [Caulobacter sp.]
MRRVILSTGVAMSLLFTSGLGTVQAAPAAKNAPAAEAAKPAPSPRSLELARRYFDAIRMTDTVRDVLEGIDPVMALGEDAEDGTDSATMRASINEAFVAAMPEYIDALVPIVAGIFTEEELEAMVAFYESPLGRSSTAKAAQMTAPTTEVMIKLLPRILEDAMERYCSKTTCSDELREKIKKMES